MLPAEPFQTIGAAMKKLPIFRVMPMAAVLSAAAMLEATAADTTVKITRKECQQVVRHQPTGNVAYKPETEIRGRKFAPADVNGGFQIDLPEVFEFNITRDVNYYLGKPKADAEAAQAAANAAAQAQAAASSAESSASAAETLAAQSQALVAIEDATAAVSSLSDARATALAKYTANPQSGRARRDYESADAALTTAQASLTSAETSYAWFPVPASVCRRPAPPRRRR
jgi:hypothetical protein